MADAWDDVSVKREQIPTDRDIVKDMGVDPDAEVKESSPLKSSAVIKRYHRVRDWWLWVRSQQTNSRNLRIKDHDKYDGDQWEKDDKEIIEERGQKATVHNLIKPTVDWIIGTEKRTRIDYKVLPRTKDDTKGAETKTAYMKYLSDVNREPFHRSRAFGDTAISGLGWLELGVRSDPEDEPIYHRYEDWRNMWYDPFSVELDLSDARFLFRSRIVDLDIACAMFPEHAGALKAAATNSNTYFDDSDNEDESELTVENEGEDGDGIYHYYESRRSRIRLIECWYTIPEKKTLIRGKDLGTLDGAIYDESNAAMKQLVEQNYASTYDALRKTIRCMMFAEGMTYPLQDDESPYRHNRFPFVPIWASRKKRGNEPYGKVRNIIDPQDDLNKRWSKSLFILSSNRAIVDDDAVTDWDEFYDELNRPDGVIKKKRGSDVDIQKDTDLAQAHIMLMAQDAQMIQDTGGVTDENMGRQTNATSGRAIEKRQDQGHVVNAEIFDNTRLAVQIAGEIELSLMEQFVTEERTFRVTGDRGNTEFMTINGRGEDGELNDITARKADFVVDQQAYNATVRQSMFESMMEMVEKLLPAAPEAALALLDLVVDMSDVPRKEEIVRRIRAINGQDDPDADPNDPAVRQQKQQEMRQQMRQQKIEELMQELTVELAAAKVDKTKAETDKIEAEADKVESEIGDNREKRTIEKAKVLSQIEKDERADAQQNSKRKEVA